MIKYFILPVMMTVSLFGYNNSSRYVTSNSGQSKMHRLQQKHPDRLPDDQRHVWNMLSPLYQRIYMYALDDDQRESVAVFERRGENPYRAIDNILKRDRRRSDPSMNMDKSPRGRTKRASEQKQYIISERNNAYSNRKDEVYDSTDDDYEMYSNEAISHGPKQTATIEKDQMPEKHSHRPCNSCSGKKMKQKVSKKQVTKKKTPAKSRCSGCSDKGPCKRKSKVKYEYKETLKKKCNSGCNH